MSSGTRKDQPSWRGPFRSPPPEVMSQVERTREKDELDEDDVVYLAQMDLPGVDLAGEFLGDGTLYETNLAGARLDGASLRRAMAGGLVLRGGSCCGTDFYKAALEAADLSEALGHFAYFCRADVSGARFDQASLFHASFAGATCSRTSFVGADLRGADLSEATLSAADLQDAQLWGANLEGISLSADTRLAGAVGVEEVNTHLVRFEGEQFTGDAARDLLVKLAQQPRDL